MVEAWRSGFAACAAASRLVTGYSSLQRRRLAPGSGEKLTPVNRRGKRARRQCKKSAGSRLEGFDADRCR